MRLNILLIGSITLAIAACKITPSTELLSQSKSLDSSSKNTLAFKEIIVELVGSGGSYYYTNGTERPSDLIEHPHKDDSSGISSAAGKYAVTYTDYKDNKEKASIVDFSPSSQDKLALYLMKKSGATMWVKKISHSTYSFAMALNAARYIDSWSGVIPYTNPNKPTYKINELFKKFKSIRETIEADDFLPAEPAKVSSTVPKPQAAFDPYESVKAEGNNCSAAGIFLCLKSNGGSQCYKSCGKSKKFFCEEAVLNSCLAGEGGDEGCHQKACDGGGHGYFDANAEAKRLGLSPNKLTNLKAGGIGYDFYDPLKTGTVKTVLRIKELAKRVYRRTGVPLYIGDLSNSWGGNSGRHAGHIGGKEVDIAVMGNTPETWVTNYYSQGADLNASKVLIEEMIAMGGVRLIYFNDPKIRSAFPSKVKYAGGHNDHYHVYWDAD